VITEELMMSEVVFYIVCFKCRVVPTSVARRIVSPHTTRDDKNETNAGNIRGYLTRSVIQSNCFVFLRDETPIMMTEGEKEEPFKPYKVGGMHFIMQNWLPIVV
jgi:hypothetical protein